MTLTILFGACLLVAVLVSGMAARTVLSTSLIFLLTGALAGQGGLGLVSLDANSPLVGNLADLALFTVLFVDGTALRNLRGEGSWRQPARALGVGMPLAFGGVAVLAHFLAGFDWITSMLVGAVLAPTDPVFASAIVGRSDVPARLRRLLSVESGLNDGLALPAVMILISAAASSGEHAGVGLVVLELLGGLALGVLLPLAVHQLLRVPGLGVEPRIQPLGPLAVGILLYGIAHLTGLNPYLAAFAGGVMVARLNPAAQESFAPLGDQCAELAKFAALLVFGALLTPALLASVGVGGWIVAVLSLVLVRPASLYLSLLGGNLERRELFAAAWFGPKGFASVVYGLLVLHSGIPQAKDAYELVAVCIGLSIIAHSSTDVPVARMFQVEAMADLPEQKVPAS
ncbi:cation:proton antiporter [Microlunatus panaciterrae]|uniref:NhaP-type Na+/H+ or K+/H+ antiporter n=1 Tax=Microlunatus panaciterrae TaxID=400768 RepID=A0ABS2RGX1_9ACTN|nr:cation:proton antiporter [Microlunatus panaciterrae]MBM7798246.1 NhaP-type Na+/H+ or K+/H+ antiporter [Microlunatus panaciterrae]